MTGLSHYVTRVVTVEGLQLTEHNVPEVAALTGAEHIFDYSSGYGIPSLKLKTEMGTIKVGIGMWLVRNRKGQWTALTNKNFRNKYELANLKGERVPPYSKGSSDDE